MIQIKKRANNSYLIGAIFFALLMFLLKFRIYAAAGVPENGNVYNGHTYQVMNQSMSWEDAEKYCESLGGHLVTVTSNEENAYIGTLAKSAGRNCYWIGLFSKDGKWNWVTGEPLDYTNWTVNEPNNYEGKGEFYAHLFGRQWEGAGTKYVSEWNDVSNSGAEYANPFYALENFGFICEWDSLPKDGADEPDTNKPDEDIKTPDPGAPDEDIKTPDPGAPDEDIKTPDPDASDEDIKTPSEGSLQELLDQVKVTISRKSYDPKQKGKIKIRLPEGLSQDDIKSVRYASSDKDVASISKSGIITARKSGKAVIYVKITFTGGSVKEFSCPVSVTRRRVKTGGR